jgi:arginyl-tRNA synthetase
MFNKIALDISKAFKEEFNLDIKESDIVIEKTNKEFVGDLTFVVFPFLRQVKLSPLLTAERLGSYLIQNSSLISEFNVKKGFLNLSLKSSFWLSEFNYCLQNEQVVLVAESKLYMVEYSSPNTNKTLHLGHLRNNFFT